MVLPILAKGTQRSQNAKAFYRSILKELAKFLPLALIELVNEFLSGALFIANNWASLPMPVPRVGVIHVYPASMDTHSMPLRVQNIYLCRY